MSESKQPRYRPSQSRSQPFDLAGRRADLISTVRASASQNPPSNIGILTKIWASRTPERIAQEATSTAACRLARIERCLTQSSTIILAHLTNLAAVVVCPSIQHNDRFLRSLFCLVLCQPTGTALARALTPDCTASLNGGTGRHGAHPICRRQQCVGVD